MCRTVLVSTIHLRIARLDGIVWMALLLGSVAPAVAAGVAAGVNPFLPAGVEDRGWPFLRGPNFDGHSPEICIADHWPAGGPPVLWIRELGQGYSAFVSDGARVYTQAQSLGGQFVYCLNADTGETVWRYRYGAPYQLAGVYPGPRATPTLSQGRVYFAAPDGLVGCLTADQGEVLWRKNLVQEYDGRGGTGFGYSCSPTVVDGKVILPIGGAEASLVALDARDGTEVWSSGSDPSSYTPAYPICHGGRMLVIGYLENSLVICDLHSGAVVMRKTLSHGYDEHAAWPIYREPYLWFSGPFRSGSQLLKIASTPEGTKLERIWQDRILSNDVASSVLVGDYIYGFDIFDVQAKTHRPSRGKFRCLEMLTGEVQWSQGTGRPRRSSASPERTEPEIGQAGIVAVDGKLILLNEVGELILLRSTPEQYHELARVQVLGGQLTWTPPVLHRGRLYLRNHARAVCVYVGDPELLQRPDSTLRVADVPQTEYRDLATRILAVEPEYAFDVPSREWLWNWYLASLAILVGAEVLAACSVAAFRPWSGRWWHCCGLDGLTRLLAFVAGALGTTLLSRWTGDFVFTWQVCLFVVFERTVDVDRRNLRQRAGRWRALRNRLPLLLLLVVCGAYFLICRRLGLLLEWVFLAGFIGAVPWTWIKSRLRDNSVWHRCWRFLLTLVAFSCFFAVSAALLSVKY